jgi:FkbM family methyltransferase
MGRLQAGQAPAAYLNGSFHHHRGGKVMRAPDKKQALAELRSRSIPVTSILDVGVNRDTAELRLAFPDKRHILFEPIAEFHEDIARNYAGIDHVAVCAAVSDEEGEAVLETIAITGGAITHSQIVAGDAAAVNRRRVPMVTLDGYVSRNRVTPPFFLKIDVDGVELAVLRGATATLADTSVVMVEAPKSELWQRIRMVAESGFEIFDLVEPAYYDGSFWQCDAIMIRKDLQRAHFGQLEEGFISKKYKKFHLAG